MSGSMPIRALIIYVLLMFRDQIKEHENAHTARFCFGFSLTWDLVLNKSNSSRKLNLPYAIFDIRFYFVVSAENLSILLRIE